MLRSLSVVFLALALSAASAPASARQSEPGVTTSRAGLGDSKERPTGQFQLPDGVEVAGPIRGHTPYDEENCSNDHDLAQGAGHMVQVCLGLRHVGSGMAGPGMPIRVTIPPGTIFIAEDDSTQNGILVRRVTRILRPGETQYIWLHLMCLNANRDSSGSADIFTLGPVLQNPGFNNLFSRLEGKRIPVEVVGVVQSAVWKIAEGRPVSEPTWSVIDELEPDPEADLQTP